MDQDRYRQAARRLFGLTAPTLLVIALIIAVAGQILVDVVGADPAILLPGVVLIYGGLLSAWHDAVRRVSGTPNVWFTVIVPILVAVQAVGMETANATGFEIDTSAVGAYRNSRCWTSGLIAWSLFLLHIAIVIGGLAGIPLSTFGETTRTDEIMVYAASLPFLGMAVAVVFAPQTRPFAKVGIGTLILAAGPAWLVTNTVLTGLCALGVAGLIVTRIGTRTTPATA